jgi:hypothetical protein
MNIKECHDIDESNIVLQIILAQKPCDDSASETHFNLDDGKARKE